MDIFELRKVHHFDFLIGFTYTSGHLFSHINFDWKLHESDWVSIESRDMFHFLCYKNQKLPRFGFKMSSFPTCSARFLFKMEPWHLPSATTSEKLIFRNFSETHFELITATRPVPTYLQITFSKYIVCIKSDMAYWPHKQKSHS